MTVLGLDIGVISSNLYSKCWSQFNGCPISSTLDQLWSFHQTSGILGCLPLSTISPAAFIKQKQKETNSSTEKNPMRLLSFPTLKPAPTFNTKCFCFVPTPLLTHSLPSSADTKEDATLWANDSKKILGPQCVHSSLDSFALGSAFKVRGYCETVWRKSSAAKGIGKAFVVKCDVKVLPEKHLVRFMSFKKPNCQLVWTLHATAGSLFERSGISFGRRKILGSKHNSIVMQKNLPTPTTLTLQEEIRCQYVVFHQKMPWWGLNHLHSLGMHITKAAKLVS